MKLRKQESSRAQVDGARLIREAWTCSAHSQNRVYVTLITPRRFRDTAKGSRLYAYRFEEYRKETSTLLREWQAVASAMAPREERRWAYPDNVEAQAQRLRFHWTTYEDLLSAESIPDTPLRAALVAAAGSWNGT